MPARVLILFAHPALSDGALDLAAGRQCERLNAELERLITGGSVA